jgi:hypothetical protein
LVFVIEGRWKFSGMLRARCSWISAAPEHTRPPRFVRLRLVKYAIVPPTNSLAPTFNVVRLTGALVDGEVIFHAEASGGHVVRLQRAWSELHVCFHLGLRTLKDLKTLRQLWVSMCSVFHSLPFFKLMKSTTDPGDRCEVATRVTDYFKPHVQQSDKIHPSDFRTENGVLTAFGMQVLTALHHLYSFDSIHK